MNITRNWDINLWQRPGSPLIVAMAAFLLLGGIRCLSNDRCSPGQILDPRGGCISADSDGEGDSETLLIDAPRRGGSC